MKYTKINLENFVADRQTEEKVHNYIYKFGQIVRFQSIDGDIEKAKADLLKVRATINALETKQAQSMSLGIGTFTSTTEFSTKEAISLSNAYTRKISLTDKVQRLETDKEELLKNICEWTTIVTEELDIKKVVAENIVNFTNDFATLHTVDRRTIEIFSSIAWGIRLNMPNSMEGRLKMYYNRELNRKTSEPNEYIKEVKEELQKFVRMYSPIYNEEGTSEGLFIPKNMNVNAKEVDFFIKTYFKGSKIDKMGNVVGDYSKEKAIVGELNMLMLAKMQGIKYGYR